MKSITVLLIMFLLASARVTFSNQEDERVIKALEKISNITPEGREVLKQVHEMRPLINDCPATKSLIDIVQEHISNKGAYNIFPIGWYAQKKKTSGNWKIALYHKDYQKNYQTAEWEYNPKTKELYSFEFLNAPTFWTEEGRKKPCVNR
ncbi:MAG: hypothetical protein AB1757_17840 [Acidobacteriota bacterium]